jgi:hypothetical protein
MRERGVHGGLPVPAVLPEVGVENTNNQHLLR